MLPLTELTITPLNVREGLPNEFAYGLGLHALFLAPEDDLVLIASSFDILRRIRRFGSGIPNDILLLECSRSKRRHR